MARTERPATEAEAEAAAETPDAAAEPTVDAAAAAQPDGPNFDATMPPQQGVERGHVRRDGGREALHLPSTATGENVVVTDMTQLEVVPESGYDFVDGRVVRRGGVWAAGTDRWLVEYDRG